MSEIDLCHPLILERHKNPRFFSNDPEGTIISAYNPVCGDEFQIAIEVADHKIKKVTFKGYGCAVSKAAIDIIIEQLIHLDQKEAIRQIEKYTSIIDSDHPPAIDNYPLAVFQKVKHYPSRRDCATLGSDAILKFLKNYT